MRQEHVIARLLRALSGKTQEQIAEELGVDPSFIAQVELGKVLPSQDHLEKLAAGIGLTVADTEIILRLFQALRDPRFRQGETIQDIVVGLQAVVGSLMKAAYLQLLGMHLPDGVPGMEQRQQAQELFRELEALSQEERLVVVQAVKDCQSWAFLERVCQAVSQESSRRVEVAAEWVQVAREIAKHMEGPEEWRERVRNYVAEHAASVPRSLPS